MTAPDQTPTEAQREALHPLIAEALGSDVLVCGRVWEAWGYNTMSADDFSVAGEDPDILNNVIDAVFPAIAAMFTPKAVWKCEFCGYPYAADEGNPGKYSRCEICGSEDFEHVTETEPQMAAPEIPQFDGTSAALDDLMNIRKEPNA